MSLSCTIEMSDDDLKLFNHIQGDKSDFFRFIRYKVTFNNKRIQEVTLEVTDRQNVFTPFATIRLDDSGYNLSVPNVDLDKQRISVVSSDDSRFLPDNPDGILNKFSQISGVPLSVMKKLLNECAIVNNKREPHRSVEAHEASNMKLDGSNMPNEINSLKRSEHSRLDNILMKVSSGSIKEIDVRMKERHNVITVSEDGLENPSDHDRLSSGQKQMTFFSNLLTKITSRLVMIEEPELHMHSKAQKELLQLFRECATDKQFIIETHSPIFANAGDNESTFLVTKSDGGTEVIPIDESNMERIRLEMGIAPADYFDNDCLCIVEGDSEHVSLPVFARRMGYETGIGFEWWNLGGYGNIKNLKALLKYMNSSNRKIFLLLDKNNEAEKHIDDLVGQNLIKSEMYHILDKSFEDLFSSKHLIEITKELASQKNIQFELSIDDLNALRENRQVDKILEEHWKTNNQMRDYPKKELAEKLAERDAPPSVSALIEKIMKHFGVNLVN